MGKKQIFYDPSPELIWAVRYLVDRVLDDTDLKQDFLDTLDSDHPWHPVRWLLEWLDSEDAFDRDDDALMMAASKLSIKAAIDAGDLTPEEVHAHEIEQGVRAKLAAMSAADLERLAADRKAFERAEAEYKAKRLAEQEAAPPAGLTRPDTLNGPEDRPAA
jgi:hypothetical protein